MSESVDDEDIEPSLLNAVDLQSTTWAKLRKHMGERVELLRAKNDNNLDAVQTAALRGEIKSLKNLLALGKPDAAIVANDGPAD